jgi:hypothetical protein
MKTMMRKRNRDWKIPLDFQVDSTMVRASAPMRGEDRLRATMLDDIPASPTSQDGNRPAIT